jgi:hypothetical protein
MKTWIGDNDETLQEFVTAIKQMTHYAFPV